MLYERDMCFGMFSLFDNSLFSSYELLSDSSNSERERWEESTECCFCSVGFSWSSLFSLALIQWDN